MSVETKNAKKKRYEKDADTYLVFFEQEPEFIQTDGKKEHLELLFIAAFQRKMKIRLSVLRFRKNIMKSSLRSIKIGR